MVFCCPFFKALCKKCTVLFSCRLSSFWKSAGLQNRKREVRCLQTVPRSGRCVPRPRPNTDGERYLTRRQKENSTKHRIFFDISWSFSGAREGTRTPKDKPHAPQTCASASSATLAYSVRAALRTSEVGSRLCGLLEYSTTFAGNRQAFFGFFIDFFGVHILIEPTKIQKQRAREVLACVCLYHVCGGCF